MKDARVGDDGVLAHRAVSRRLRLNRISLSRKRSRGQQVGHVDDGWLFVLSSCRAGLGRLHGWPSAEAAPVLRGARATLARCGATRFESNSPATIPAAERIASLSHASYFESSNSFSPRTFASSGIDVLAVERLSSLRSNRLHDVGDSQDSSNFSGSDIVLWYNGRVGAAQCIVTLRGTDVDDGSRFAHGAGIVSWGRNQRPQ